MDNIVKTVGLDLAKNSFHVFCADREGRLVESKALRRGEALQYFAKLGPCVVAMETCTGANWWCRQIKEQGHDARLIPAAYVKPYAKSQKNDALDAEAICEAAAKKLIYLSLREASANWKGPMLNWQSAKREFAIHFGDRFNPSKGWVTKA